MSASRKSIGIGLMGMGVVGGGVAKLFVERGEDLARQVGCPLNLRKILVRDLAERCPVDELCHLRITDAREVLDDPEIDIVIEAMGGEHPALDYVREALLKGKSVATANKEIVAKHGAELLRIAEEHTVELLYEASVGGGIPIIAPMRQNLAANKVSALYAIINGTTNYILTNMAEEGLDFSAALERAQRLGYAEADPANDIEGIDAAYKLAILASIAFHTDVCFRDVFHEGISRIARRDFKYAQELGYAIKLLAIAKKDGDLIEVRVHPTFIPEDALLAKVSGVYNAIQLEGDLVGKMLFYGEGAGANPTSSAVIADVISIGRGIISGVGGRQQPRFDAVKVIKPISEIQTRYYLRMNVSDEPGVLAQISRVLGDHLISISSVIQKESDERTQSAEIVIMTHPARESAMQQALTRIEQLPVIRDIGNFIRVEG